MSSIEEKRVYGGRRGPTAAFVATGAGVVRVRVADDHVGEFDLVRRCAARDVAGRPFVGDTESTGAGPGVDLAVATDEDVLVGEAGSSESADGGALEPTGFGPAVAVGFDGETPLAAGPEGRVARHSGDGWEPVGSVEGARALDGDLMATDAGVYRVGKSGLRYVGLDRVRDVAAAGVPRAATADGLYRLGNGWMDELPGSFNLVTADPYTAVRSPPGRAHAATADALFALADGTWETVALPVEAPVVGVGYAAGTYAVTADGTFLAAADAAGAGADWRTCPLGLDASALAVPAGGKGVYPGRQDVRT